MDYYITSVIHTNRSHEHIQWWGRMECGYTTVLGDKCGRYVYGYAVDLNDGETCVAVPVPVVDAVATADPYMTIRGQLHRFYDQRGPVVLNTRANWNRIIRDSLTEGRTAEKVVPEVFRGRRHAIYTEQDVRDRDAAIAQALAATA